MIDVMLVVIMSAPTFAAILFLLMVLIAIQHQALIISSIQELQWLPIVTGAIALLWQQNPDFTNEQIIQILIGSATLITNYGHSKLNVANMLSKTMQEKILQSSIPEVHTLCEQQTRELFPDITIYPNNFAIFCSKQLQGKFNFTRLTREDVIAFANTDLKYLRYSWLLSLQRQVLMHIMAYFIRPITENI